MVEKVTLQRWALQPGTGSNNRGEDLADALVNKPDNAAAIRVRYKGLWSDAQLPNALKNLELVSPRQYEIWDWVTDQPGETLKTSVEYSRYNSWTAGGNYIWDTLSQPDNPEDSGNSAPGEPKYRPKPDEAGYTGPYWTLVTT